MKPRTTIYSLLAGLSLAAVCMIGIVVKSTILVFIVSHFLPGLTFSFILVRNTNQPLSFNRKLSFMLATVALYTGAVMYVDMNESGANRAPVIFVVLSSIASFLLVLLYDLMLLKITGSKISYLLSWVPGFVASIPGALCLYYFPKIALDQELQAIYFWLGLFSIFPIWFFLFTWYIVSQRKMHSIPQTTK